MKKVYLFYLFFSCLAIEPDLFDTSFLTHTDLVHEYLVNKKGMQEVQFTTGDGVSLAGLWKKSPDANYTVIICGGFYPGNKESMATFIDIIPQEVNVLLFDARGHGNSNGRFFSALYAYGLYEYLDIISAISFAQKQSDTPIIVYGLCAGAFHAARALIELYKTNNDMVAGFIFDSGIASLLDVLDIPSYHIKESVIPWIFKNNFYQNDAKQQVKDRYLVRFCNIICSGIIHLLTLVHKPFIVYNEKITNLYDEFHLINCPIFFIHSYDDTYSPIEHIKKLSDQVQSKSEWWIEKPSKHASHHLKHQAEYQARLLAFFSETVNTKSLKDHKL